MVLINVKAVDSKGDDDKALIVLLSRVTDRQFDGWGVAPGPTSTILRWVAVWRVCSAGIDQSVLRGMPQ